MKKFLLIALLFVLYPVIINSQSSDNTNAHKWLKEKFAKGSIPPFSFVYDGKLSDTFISSWDYKAEKLKSDEADVENFLYTYSDKNTGLVVKCFVTCYNDFNAAEYLLRFINTSSKNTPIIENASVINNVFSYNTGGTFILHHSLGSNAAVNDFQPFDEEMQIGKSIYMSPSRGRSSDEKAFPFFNIETPAQQGIIVAVGWSGKWYADVVQRDERSVSLKSGMENMHLTLYPKEEIRTPRICMLFWNGKDRMVGHNQFRRFILAHHTRKINGSIPQLPLSVSFELDGPPSPCTVHTCITEASALAHIKRYQQFKLFPDLFWLDAGWYTGCGWDKEDGGWAENVGNWTIDKGRFPNGLKPVSDAAHAAGAKFLVWFEPERVRVGTQLYKEHPDWLLSIPDDDNNLLDLGNTEIRLWLTNYLTDFIKKEGIDYYRQDCNFDPSIYWKRYETSERIGISEAKHIEGLYAFWDSLLVRFPNMIIDNCAAGGRRIDLETTSRSTPFWRTDLEQNSTGHQCHSYGLNLYLPLHGTALYRTGKYYVRSSLGSTAVINWSVNGSNNETIQSYQQYMEDYKRLRQYYYADYYPLTLPKKHYMDANFWLAYQLNRPEQKDGIVLAFRREKNQEESIQVKLSGLNPSSAYELYYEDSGLKIIKSGKELMEGIEIRIPEKPGSLLISYRVNKE
ncbi:MAG: alpha-galactosidase [Bacteroidota bacterium]|nr:alpha-galactosidase [Bacteroidota bacterium]MDP4196642.1 alpha-galactosidase [Bacteroidota bacterium]